MTERELESLAASCSILTDLRAGREIAWINPGQVPFETASRSCELTMADIDQAEARLARFAPFLMACFPELRAAEGVIESPLTPVPRLQKRLEEKYGVRIPGHLLLKQDNALAVAGSVKARGASMRF